MNKTPSTRSEAILAAADKVRARLQSHPQEKEEGVGLIYFDLGNNRFAVEIEHVAKIERPPKLTPVPNTPLFVLGITNLRGEILAVLDLVSLLSLEADDEARGLLILTDGQHKFGVISHSLPDYIKISPDIIEPAPKSLDIVGNILSGAVRIQDRFMGIIEIPRLFAFVERFNDVS